MNTPLKTVLSGLLFLSLLPFSEQALCYSTGIIGHSGESGSDCKLCHSGGTAPNAAITGPDSVEAGSVASYVLTMSGGQQNLAGFNVSASAGALHSASTGVGVQSGELKHNGALTVGSSETSWQFEFTAPATEGGVVIYAAVLSANGDSDMGGDNSVEISFSVEVTPAQRLLPPTVVLGGPFFALPDESISFDASASGDSDGEVVRYLWDFGDGSEIVEGAQVNHAYALEGEYSITLAATDNDGLSTAIASTVSISANAGSAQGEALYNQYCFSCHGAGGIGGIASNVTGTSVDAVNNGISTVAGMQTISLSAEQIQMIVDYLASGGGGEPPPRPTDGPGLYAMFCAACHGVDGRGGSAIAVTGVPTAMINEGIANVTVMQAIDLSAEEINKVAEFLIAGGSGTLPDDGSGLYQVFCSACHGDGGHGARFLAVTGAPVAMINDAIGNLEWMQPLSHLSQEQRDLIAVYLSNGGSGQIPADGPGLYGVYCAVCHGADGRGGKYKIVTGSSAAYVNDALVAISLMQHLDLNSNQTSLISDYLANGGSGEIPVDGAGLYHVYCATCHGDGGHGGRFLAVTGAPAAMISDAISNQAWMTALAHLSPAQIGLIADYLTAGGSGQPPSDGPGLYGVYCAVCHGADGRGGIYKVVTGSSNSFISGALRDIPLMRELNLGATQIERIGAFLAAGGTGVKPSDGAGLYYVYCETCHGANGRGGPEENVVGASISEINSAIVGEAQMRQLSPYLIRSGSGSDSALISNFLNNQ